MKIDFLGKDKEGSKFGKEAIKAKHTKVRKKRWDAILVAVGMIISFILILVKLTGYWPCDIVNILNLDGIGNVFCSGSVTSSAPLNSLHFLALIG
jgi:hypothetical protein